MQLNKREIELIKSKIQEKLTPKFFTFKDLEIKQNGVRLHFEFSEIKHTVFKNIVILSGTSHVHDTILNTYAEIDLRFLYNGRNSPAIGHNLVKFKVLLS